MAITVVQFTNKINQKIAELKQDRILKLAVLTINQARIKRIFEDGINSNGNKIGTYSTKPMLATKRQFLQESKFKQTVIELTRLKGYVTPKGKQRSKEVTEKRPIWIKFKKAKKAVPIMYIEGGYKEFRKLQGRESSFVNLRYTNELQSDLANAQIGKSSSAIATPNPIKISNTEYQVTLKKDINIKKIEGLEKKYGKILAHTRKEYKLFSDVIQKETALILAK